MDNQLILERVEGFISRHDLMHKDKKYLVALSGGADSISLLRILQDLGYDLEAAHCNFHLRGKEADRDEKFCQQLCEKLNIPFHIAHFDTKEYAKEHGISIEMAARDLRYAYFYQLIDELGCDGICVAHHRNDSVETVLLNLVRGTGIEGLKGIAPKNNKTIRPLLAINRTDITTYLMNINQKYVVDSTNLKADVQRNMVRRKIIPLLLEVNQQANSNISRCAHYVSDALELLKKAVEEARPRIVKEDTEIVMKISIPDLQQETAAETILWATLKGKGFNPAQVQNCFAALGGQSGKQWESDTHRMLIDRDMIIIEPISDEPAVDVEIHEDGTYLSSGKKNS